MSRGEGVTQSPLARLLFDEGTDKTFSKNFEKPLDKRHKMCYNNNVIKRSHLLKSRKETKTMAMTEREFLTKVLAIEGITDEVKGYATEGIAKLDARNDKRKNTQTKAQKENVETMKSIVATITANGAMFASDIGAALGISTQKASALCKLLVTDGTLSVADVKVKNKGAVKQYSLATPTAEEPSAEDEGEEVADA